ncbi:MAG: hypothetical protein H6739_10540 [Alphaproteobacteria bacterium]|nr:hypothetical protein [Alphaproteobacteria bacterium]
MLSLIAAWALLAPAHAAEAMLGVGVRGTVGGAGFVEGPRVIGAADLGWFSLEGNLMVNPRPDRYTSMDRALVVKAHNQDNTVPFQVPVQNDILAAQVLLSVDALSEGALDWREMREATLAGSPRLYAGAEAHLSQRSYLRYDVSAADNVRSDPADRSFGMGLVLGAGLDLWWGHRVGLRPSWCARATVEDRVSWDSTNPENGRDMVVRHAYVLDLVVKL